MLDVDDPAGAVEDDADGVEADLGVARDGRGASAIQAVASRRTLALLAGVDREDRALGAEAAPARPALTSTKTRARPSRATMSSSPWRVRALRSTIRQPAAARRSATSCLGAAAGAAAGVGSSAWAQAAWASMKSPQPRAQNVLRTSAPRVRICLRSVAAVLATARTFTLDGISARPVRVEVDVHRGLPGFAIVGLPDAAVREARERVRAALVNCGFEFPLQRIVVNLAPASLRKAGPGMDLAIAAALLSASGQLEWEGLARVALAGELALDGTTRPIHGALAIAEAAREGGAEAIVVPAENGPEAALASGVEVVPLDSVGRAAGAGGRRVGAGPAGAAARCEPSGAAGAPTSPTCAASRTCATRSRSPRPAATAC